MSSQNNPISYRNVTEQEYLDGREGRVSEPTLWLGRQTLRQIAEPSWRAFSIQYNVRVAKVINYEQHRKIVFRLIGVRGERFDERTMAFNNEGYIVQGSDADQRGVGRREGMVEFGYFLGKVVPGELISVNFGENVSEPVEGLVHS